MPDLLRIERGAVAERLHDAVSREDRLARSVRLTKEANAMEEDWAAAERAVALPRGTTFADAEKERTFRAQSVSAVVASYRAEAAMLSAPDARMLLDAYLYSESEIGMAPVWPRAYRNALLAATDFVEMAGWRSGKADAVLSAADAYRAALRALPEAQPDPLTVTFPDKPAGL